MTFRVSDEQISIRQILLLAFIHDLISFVYNTVVLELVHIIEGLILK